MPGADGIAISNLIGLDLVEHALEVAPDGGAEHAQPVLVLQPALARIVVDEADRAHPQLGVAHQLAHDQATALAGADDQHLTRALGHAQVADAALGDEVREEAHAGEQRGHQQQEEHRHAGRQRNVRPG